MQLCETRLPRHNTTGHILEPQPQRQHQHQHQQAAGHGLVTHKRGGLLAFGELCGCYLDNASSSTARRLVRFNAHVPEPRCHPLLTCASNNMRLPAWIPRVCTTCMLSMLSMPWNQRPRCAGKSSAAFGCFYQLSLVALVSAAALDNASRPHSISFRPFWSSMYVPSLPFCCSGCFGIGLLATPVDSSPIVHAALLFSLLILFFTSRPLVRKRPGQTLKTNTAFGHYIAVCLSPTSC